MAKKPNPLLAAFEAQLTAEHRRREAIMGEINLMATIIAANNELQVGPGRAGFFTAEVLDTKMQIADCIVREDDPELLYTKYHLAKRLKEIFSPEDWVKYRELFPLLMEYWD